MTSSELFKYLFRSGKNNRLAYVLRNLLLGLVPDSYYRTRRSGLLAELDKRPDKTYILDRVDYYCRLNAVTTLSADARMVGEFRRKGHGTNYFFDSYQYVRYFPKQMRWKYAFGDIRDLQAEPSIVKSRPVCADNQNSVLLNLDKVRHFVFVHDKLKFTQKKDMAVFRGEIWQKPWRIAFFRRWFGDRRLDIGEYGHHYENPSWRGSMLTIPEHLQFKYVVSIEGNDVATNLKWVMSSNSLAVMPRPTCETWFMEGRLIPNYHYVEIKSDYSDLIERMDYYTAHPDEAENIIRHAHEWVAQFRDSPRERLISLLTLDKYFRMTAPQ